MQFFNSAFSGITTNDLYKPKPEKSGLVNNINEQKLQKLEAELKRYQLRMENEGFRKSASAEVQEKHAQKVTQFNYFCFKFIHYINIIISIIIIIIFSTLTFRIINFFQIQQLVVEIEKIKSIAS